MVMNDDLVKVKLVMNYDDMELKMCYEGIRLEYVV